MGGDEILIDRDPCAHVADGFPAVPVRRETAVLLHVGSMDFHPLDPFFRSLAPEAGLAIHIHIGRAGVGDVRAAERVETRAARSACDNPQRFAGDVVEADLRLALVRGLLREHHSVGNYLEHADGVARNGAGLDLERGAGFHIEHLADVLAVDGEEQQRAAGGEGAIVADTVDPTLIGERQLGFHIDAANARHTRGMVTAVAERHPEAAVEETVIIVGFKLVERVAHVLRDVDRHVIVAAETVGLDHDAALGTRFLDRGQVVRPVPEWRAAHETGADRLDQTLDVEQDDVTVKFLVAVFLRHLRVVVAIAHAGDRPHGELCRGDEILVLGMML